MNNAVTPNITGMAALIGKTQITFKILLKKIN